MIDYLFVYEHKAREIENICLLKAELERRNYRVDIVQYHSTNTLKYLWYKKPKVVIVYALYGDRELRYHVSRLCGKISKIVNLQCEQALTDKALAMDFSVPKENAKDAVHICWGTERQSYLQERGIKHAIVTGALQMDFLRKPLKEYFFSRQQILSEFQLLEDKKIILYMSSFAYTTASKEELDYMKSFTDSETVQEMYMIHTESKKITLNWFERVLKDNSDIVIIYRPHPAERIDDELKRLEQTYCDFKVISKYSVKQWILVCDKIYTMFSSSIAEAYFAKKLCMILRPVHIPSEIDSVLYRDAEMIMTYEEFVKSLNVYSFLHFPVPKENFEKYYEDTLSYKKVCDLLEDIYRSDIYDMPRKMMYDNSTVFVEVIKILVKKILSHLKFLCRFCNCLPRKIQYEILQFYRLLELAENERCSKEEIWAITDKIKKLI